MVLPVHYILLTELETMEFCCCFGGKRGAKNTMNFGLITSMGVDWMQLCDVLLQNQLIKLELNATS
jgi:hypothetical protein